MSGSSGNTSSGRARERAPRDGNAEITARHAEQANEPASEPLGADVTEAAGGIGQQQRDTKHPEPDDANAAARKEPDR